MLGHADLIKPETLVTIKNYPNTKIVQWFLDRMDVVEHNKRFIDKINLMDVNFCTTSLKHSTLNLLITHITYQTSR